MPTGSGLIGVCDLTIRMQACELSRKEMRNFAQTTRLLGQFGNQSYRHNRCSFRIQLALEKGRPTMRKLRWLTTALVLALLSGSTTNAQEQRLVTRTDFVSVNVIVTDKSGRYVRG